MHNHTGRRKRCLGSFASEREAAEAYDKAALTLRSNIPPFFQLRIVAPIERNFIHRHKNISKFALYLLALQSTHWQLLCHLHTSLSCLVHMRICSDSNLFVYPHFPDLPCIHILLLSHLCKECAMKHHVCKLQQPPQLGEDHK